MVTPAAIRAYLLELYPEPPPDLTWVTDCHAALVEAGHPATPSSVEEQYLYSDLGLSTTPSLRGRGLPGPDEVERHTGVIRSPVIVQIHAVTDIGVSAFALSRTLDERRDVLSGATRIRRMDEEEDEEEEGKLPPYARSMLSLEVSDGRTAMRAIEYRRVEGLVLAEIPLGTKLRLRNVKCLKGTLLLTPENTEVLGGAVDALEQEQGEKFVEGLQARLATARNVPPAATQTRRRTLPVRTSRPVAAAPPARAPAVRRAVQTSAEARAARRAALLAADEDDGPQQVVLRAAGRGASRARPHPPSDSTLADDSFEIDDSFIRVIDAVEAAASQGQSSGRQTGRSQRGQRQGQSQWGDDVEVIEISD